MCLGNTHARGGLVLGLAAGDLSSSLIHPLPLATVLCCGALAAGGALLNDLDTPSSTVSHSLGRYSQGVGRAVQWLSQAAFELTATSADHRHASPVHRALTHTLIFAVALTAGVTTLAQLGWWATLGIAFTTLGLALRTLTGRLRLRGMSLLVTTTAVAALITYVGPPAILVGGSVGVGVLSHDLLDGCTTMGVPFWWPLRLGGMRWRRVGLPRFARFHTGERVEPWVARLLTVVTVPLLPPVLTMLQQFLKVAVYN